jgi:hypothetical protein
MLGHFHEGGQQPVLAVATAALGVFVQALTQPSAAALISSGVNSPA